MNNRRNGSKVVPSGRARIMRAQRLGIGGAKRGANCRVGQPVEERAQAAARRPFRHRVLAGERVHVDGLPQIDEAGARAQQIPVLLRRQQIARRADALQMRRPRTRRCHHRLQGAQRLGVHRRHLHRQTPARRQRRHHAREQRRVIADPVQRRVGEDKIRRRRRRPSGEVGGDEPAAGGGVARLRQHRLRPVHPHHLGARKARRQQRRHIPRPASQIDDQRRVRQLDPRQQVDRRA